MTHQTKPCKRCKAQGWGSWVVNGGICFNCNGRGWTYADKFVEVYSAKPGRFFGVSMQLAACYAPLTVLKCIRTEAEIVKDGATVEKCLALDPARGTKYTEITEEQARAFFAKYGTEVRK